MPTGTAESGCLVWSSLYFTRQYSSSPSFQVDANHLYKRIVRHTLPAWATGRQPTGIIQKQSLQ